jgi:hypothetical protein
MGNPMDLKEANDKPPQSENVMVIVDNDAVGNIALTEQGLLEIAFAENSISCKEVVKRLSSTILPPK